MLLNVVCPYILRLNCILSSDLPLLLPLPLDYGNDRSSVPKELFCPYYLNVITLDAVVYIWLGLAQRRVVLFYLFVCLFYIVLFFSRAGRRFSVATSCYISVHMSM